MPMYRDLELQGFQQLPARLQTKTLPESCSVTKCLVNSKVFPKSVAVLFEESADEDRPEDVGRDLFVDPSKYNYCYKSGAR